MQVSLQGKNHLSLPIIVMLATLLYSCKKFDNWPPTANEERPDVVYNWYKFIEVIQRPANPQPAVIFNFRNFGYIGVGLYEAVRPGIEGAVSLSQSLYQMPAMPATEHGKDYLWSASANAALASMFKQFLTGLTPANIVSIDSLEQVHYELFKRHVSKHILERSQAFGRAIADAIYNWSATDNFNLSSQGYTIPAFPGAWIPTPPAFANPVGPFLKDSRPFLEYSLTATAPAIPVPYSKDPASDFYAANREVYDIGNGLTAEQKAIADWFADSGGPGIGLPAPYHLMNVITNLLKSKHVSLGRAAVVYAKTGIAQKDGPINTFRAKFQYNLIRPVSYINQHIDADWKTYLATPPYPEYPSGLAGIYTPVIQVLKREFGDIPVSDDANAWKGMAPRHYPSLSAYAKEAAESRIYAGIHYRFTQDLSLVIGEELGNMIADIEVSGGLKK